MHNLFNFKKAPAVLSISITSILLVSFLSPEHTAAQQTFAPQDNAASTGPVSVISGDSLIQRPANYFNLEGKTVHFTRSGETSYTAQVLPLDFQSNRGTQLQYASATTTSYEYGWSIALPFTFPFAGQSWNSVFVNLNGNISFGASEGSTWPQRDPWPDGTMRSVAAVIDSRAGSGTERMIAAFWAIYSSQGSAIYTNISPQGLVITWEVTRPIPYDTLYTPLGLNVFQAKLFPSGDIDLTYKQVPERDGIVGIFAGSTVNSIRLDHGEHEREVPDPITNIASVDVYDAGTTLKFTITMTSDIPSSVPTGQLGYRVFFEHLGRQCQFGVNVSDAVRAWSFCSETPGVIGFQIEGKTLSLSLSKVLVENANNFSWAVDVVWWGTTRPFDSVASFDRMRVVNLAGSAPGVVDFSSASGNFSGNIFEVFHYPAYSKFIEESLRVIYQRFPPEDDIAIIFTDFRIDDLYSQGPSTGGRNVPIQGIGAGLDSPPSGSGFGSTRLQVSMSPVYVGAPRFAESVTDGNRQYSGYAFAVGWIGHEGTHRWGVSLNFRNPLTGQTQSLEDPFCGCHWNDDLNAPSIFTVAREYTANVYPESSIMGGNVWEENPDGTFTKREKPYLVPNGYSALDLYIMGLIAPEEVPDTFILQNITDLGNNRVRATKVPVRIQDIIAVMGARVPSSTTSQKEFTLGVYLVHEPGRAPYSDMLSRAKGISGALAKYFNLATGGRMHITYAPNSGQGDFFVTASPSSQAISPGASTSFVLNVQGVNGLTQPVNLTASVSPPNSTVNVSFSSNAVTPGGSATLTVSTQPNTPPSVFTINITGTAAGIVHTVTATVTLVAGPSISSAVFDGGKNVTIEGSKFGSSPRVLINSNERTDFETSASDTVIKVKGKSKKLSLKVGDNTIQVIDASGAASNVFILRI